MKKIAANRNYRMIKAGGAAGGAARQLKDYIAQLAIQAGNRDQSSNPQYAARLSALSDLVHRVSTALNNAESPTHADKPFGDAMADIKNFVTSSKAFS